MSKASTSDDSREVLNMIAALEPFREDVERVFRRELDPSPVVGWLPQCFELHKRGLLHVKRLENAREGGSGRVARRKLSEFGSS
jgi:hypothetical protein